MKSFTLFSISGIALLIGACYYAYFNEWIIIRNPWHSLDHPETYQSPLQRTTVSLYFWQHDSWHIEKNIISLPADPQDHALAVINAWLHEAYQSGFVMHVTTAQTALLDPRTHTLYVSLHISLFDLQKSTHAQLIVLESLLKTINTNLPVEIAMVQLLCNHALVENPTLDCSQPFSTSGLGIIK